MCVKCTYRSQVVIINLTTNKKLSLLIHLNQQSNQWLFVSLNCYRYTVYLWKLYTMSYITWKFMVDTQKCTSWSLFWYKRIILYFIFCIDIQLWTHCTIVFCFNHQSLSLDVSTHTYIYNYIVCILNTWKKHV